MKESFHLECPSCGAPGVWARFEEGTVVSCPDNCGAKIVLTKASAPPENPFADERTI